MPVVPGHLNGTRNLPSMRRSLLESRRFQKGLDRYPVVRRAWEKTKRQLAQSTGFASLDFKSVPRETVRQSCFLCEFDRSFRAHVSWNSTTDLWDSPRNRATYCLPGRCTAMGLSAALNQALASDNLSTADVPCTTSPLPRKRRPRKRNFRAN